jgi:hypothetical protein
MSDPVAELQALLTDQPENPLRPNQLADWQEEQARVEAMAQAPQYVTGQNRGAALRRSREISKLLAAQAPKKITDGRVNRVKALADTVLETIIRPGLLPRAVMRRNPAGAVGHFRRTEGHPVFKRAVLTWKRALRALDPENPDPDHSNYERVRPEGAHPDGVATYMADAQIPGQFAMTPQAKANYPFPDPPTSALAQVQSREAKQRGRPPKRAATPKQLAALARANAAKAASRAASGLAAGVGVPGSGPPDGKE